MMNLNKKRKKGRVGEGKVHLRPMERMEPRTERGGTLALSAERGDACECVCNGVSSPPSCVCPCPCVCIRGVSSSVGLSAQCEWSQAGCNLMIV